MADVALRIDAPVRNREAGLMLRATKPESSITRRAKLIGLGVVSALWLGLVPVAAVGALFSPLIFDRSGNLLNPLAWLGFLLMITMWIICLAAPYVAWVLFKRGQEPLAWAAMATPLAWFTALVAILQFVPG